MKHFWIIEKESSKLIFYHSLTSEELDGFMISGLLSAFNSFSEIEMRDRGIENIDMGTLRWVYSIYPELNLMFVAACERTANAKLVKARLEVIKNMFVNTYDITPDFWKENTLINIGEFKPFASTIDSLQEQWAQAEQAMNVGAIFDLLGIFQSLFIRLIKIVENNFSGLKYEYVLTEISTYIPELETWYKTQPHMESLRVIKLFIPKVDLINSQIHFDTTVGMDVFGINPMGITQDVLKPVFYIVLRKFKDTLEKTLGEEVWLHVFKNEIKPYVFQNWEFLDHFNVLRSLLDIFI